MIRLWGAFFSKQAMKLHTTGAALTLLATVYGSTQAQAPIPTPLPRSQTIVGQELAAVGQTLVETSNNVNAIVLLVIAVCVVVVILVITMIVVLKAILDAQSRADVIREAREDDEREEKRRRDHAETQRLEAFTSSVTTFAVVTSQMSAIQQGVEEIRGEKTESKRLREERDRAIDRRIDTAEDRLIRSLEHFGQRMVTETGLAMREGQQQAAQTLVDALPAFIEQLKQQPIIVIPPEDGSKIKTGPLNDLTITADTVNVQQNEPKGITDAQAIDIYPPIDPHPTAHAADAGPDAAAGTDRSGDA